MVRLKKLFTEHPSYTKWGDFRIALLTGLKERTVKNYKKSEEFKKTKREYLNNISSVKS